MKVTEEQKLKILHGAKTVLSQNKALSPDFISDKLEKITEVLMSEAESDSGKAQEIKLDPNAFSAGLEDLSNVMGQHNRL